jgi:hypothetical protein
LHLFIPSIKAQKKTKVVNYLMGVFEAPREEDQLKNWCGKNHRPIENNFENILMFFTLKEFIELFCFVINCMFDFGATINHHLNELGETKKMTSD